jgi:hypothetical protein
MAEENLEAVDDIDLEDQPDPASNDQPDDKPDDKPQDEPKDKVQETPEAKRARLERELKQHNKKYPTSKPDKPSTKSDDLDYGQLAFLAAKGVETDEKVDFVKSIVINTGRELKDVMKDDYVLTKLKEMDESAKVKAAIPSGTKRSAQTASDTVEYWLNKGELPDDVDLRRKVVNARIEKETKKDVFTP